MSVQRVDGSKRGRPRTRKGVNRQLAAWEDFCKNEELRKSHRISPGEMSALRKTALMGNVRSPRDFIFMLNIIRTSKRLKQRAEAE